MPNVTFIDASGKSRTIDCTVGTSLMKSAQQNAISGIYAECCGQKMCATCHIYVADEFLTTMPEISVDEDEMLEATACDRLPNSRLSCAIVVTAAHENLVVHLPKYQR